MQDFISSGITHGMLEQTSVIVGLVKDGILEVFDCHLGAFRDEITAGQLGAHLEPEACKSLRPFRNEDPVASFCCLGSKVGCAACL